MSPDCDAIATTGSATSIHVAGRRNGHSVSIGTMGAVGRGVRPHRQHLLIGTFSSMLQMHARSGDLLLRARWCADRH